MSDHSALIALIPPELRGSLRRAELRLGFAAPSGPVGFHRSRSTGPGNDFRDHRAYVPGDDPRRLDWRAAARRDRLIVRRTEAQVALDVVFVLDASGAMQYARPGGGDSKWARVVQLAAWLAEVTRRQGDAVGFAVGLDGSADARHLDARASPERMRALTDTLVRTSPAGACPWADLLSAVSTRLRRRSLVFVVSDFWDPGPQLDDAALLGRLEELRARGHTVAAVQILDPDEVEFPWSDASALRFDDLRGLRPTVEGAGAGLRAKYLERSRAHLERLAHRLERAGVILIQHQTDRPTTEAALSITRRLAGGPAHTVERAQGTTR